MKLSSTTPVPNTSRAMVRRVTVAFIAALFLLAGTVVYFQAKPASADQYDDKISALQSDMARYQAEADRLNGEAATLSTALAQITNEKNAIQSQVDLSQAQHDKLIIEIADTEKQISDNQTALGKTLADLYVDDNVSPVEMLASSQNIGDYLDKQEYRNSVKDQLGSTIKKVKDLKEQLTSKKDEVAQVLIKQKEARDSLVAKESEQASLLASTQNNEANFQGLIKNSQAAIDSARAAQAALRARTNATGGYQIVDGGSLAAYTWNSSNCPMVSWLSTEGYDGNGGDGHGYGCRQCASYAAWRVAKETNVYYQWGNGGDFASSAINAGYQNLGNRPQANSIAVLWGNPGHVAYVEEVSADGAKVRVTQYNYDYGSGYGMYSNMWLSSSFFNQYVKIK